MTNEKSFSAEWLGRTLTIKTGKLAKQADACVVVQYGDTVVMATAVESKIAREGINYFPLMVEMEEKLYAAGIIKGSRWIKREGRPTDESVLTGRMIDRSIRPLFPEDARKDVQVILSVLSADQENDHDIVSIIAASAVLAISGIKWDGPIGGIRVGQVEGQFILNPTYEQRKESDLDLIVAGTKAKTIMIEAGAKEISVARMNEAILLGQKEMQVAITLIEELKQNIPAKVKAEENNLISPEETETAKEKEELIKIGEAWLKDNVTNILFNQEHYTKGERKLAVEEIKKQLDIFLFNKNISKDKRGLVIKATVEKAIDTEVTNQIINNKRRVDGRKLDEIRELSADVEMLPRNHGAGLFSRGETQVLSIVTLGAPGLEQHLEGIEGVSTKSFMLHYNFPPFSVGEASPMRGTGRREIGHGALAEKAVMNMLPGKEEFAYTIRVVSETLGSNGSSSMGATCSASLALMDAGVPIKKAVAGIAIGLASNDDMSRWEVLTDIQDLEDGKGGMDFKITGTVDGITAIQLDTKTNGINEDIVKEALGRGQKAIGEILDVMNKALDKPRPELSKYAPRVTSFRIDPEKIREVIGTGGKIINKIIETHGVSIDIDDDGLVMVCGTDAEEAAKAVKWIQDIVKEFEAGEVYTGKVVRMLDFGAFIELMPGRDGMAHVSELAPYRVGKPEDIINVGDIVTVKIKEIDDQGRVNLTLKGLPENEHLWKDEKGKSDGNGGGGGNYNNNRDRGGSNRGRSRF